MFEYLDSFINIICFSNISFIFLNKRYKFVTTWQDSKSSLDLKVYFLQSSIALWNQHAKIAWQLLRIKFVHFSLSVASLYARG